MAGYLGNTPIENYSTAARQAFSSPTGTGFTLCKSVSSSNDIALFVNNIRQEPTTYTATGTTLTLTEALVSGDTMWCMFYGQATHTVTPSAGSVGDAAITAMSASKLTGSLPAGMAPDEITKSTSEPTGTTNPSGGVGTIWLRTTTGEMYCCTDATNNANVWTNIGEGTGSKPYTGMVATGGTITTDGDYKVHVFNSSGTFTITTLGDDAALEYLVVAGGGGSGGNGGGGGGAGGYRTATAFAVSAQAYTITIGAGGTGSTSNSGFAAGSNSVFSTITSLGGGKGSGTTGAGSSGTDGGDGGSGGGGTWHNSGTGTAGGDGTAGQGNNGGAGGIQGNAHSAGGGGGAGEVGEAGSNSKGGDGGDGSSSSITGSAVVRSGGGGGAAHSTGSGGAAGSGGGGKGSSNTDSGQESGTANTGGGGGGANSGSGGSGGSGVVILRYKFQ